MKIKQSVKANPATTTGTIGLVVALIGRALGFDEELQSQIELAALAAVPVVRGIVAWWDRRQAKAGA